MITTQSQALRDRITHGECGCVCMPFSIYDQTHQPGCDWNNTILAIYTLEREAEK